jgi:integrase
VSSRGAALDTQGLFDAVTGRTRAAFGRPVNPHLFRDCAATTIAIEDPVHVRVATSILGHRSPATTERYYNLARSVEAARAWQATLSRLRDDAPSAYPIQPVEESS